MQVGDVARITHRGTSGRFERSFEPWTPAQPVLILKRNYKDGPPEGVIEWGETLEGEGLWRDLVLIQYGKKTLWIPKQHLEVINESR